MATTNIEWTDKTWNPLAGCSEVSPACEFCYAKHMAHRLEGIAHSAKKYEGTTRRTEGGKTQWTGRVNFDEEALLLPLKWKKGVKIFVNSMSDLFHENVPFGWVDKIFAVMALCPQHTFQILTKRPERMREYLERVQTQVPTLVACDDNDDISGITYFRNNLPAKYRDMPKGARKIIFRTPDKPKNPVYVRTETFMHAKNVRESFKEPYATEMVNLNMERADQITTFDFPLPNVWLGVTVENQATANERIPHLLACPAKVRFLSCEPLLEAIDLRSIYEYTGVLENDKSIDCLTGRYSFEGYTSKIEWVITGGESGNAKGIRPAHPDWFRSIRNQCVQAGVAYFHKQNGAYEICDDARATELTNVGHVLTQYNRATMQGLGFDVQENCFLPLYDTNGKETKTLCYEYGVETPKLVVRVGDAGSLLDGEEHKEFPK